MALRHSHRRGDIVLVQFPFSSAMGSKQRPGVVISTDAYHDDRDDLLILAVTSVCPQRIRPADYFLQGWKQAGLAYPSWIRSHLATVHRTLIARSIGRLTPTDLLAVEDRLRLALGL